MSPRASSATAHELSRSGLLSSLPGETLGRLARRMTREDDRVTLNLYWAARVVGGEARPADDVAELRWFALEELPGPEELAFRTVGHVLAAFRHQQA